MQSSGFSSRSEQHCVWCDGIYPVRISKAMTPDMFCCRTCERQARIWLLDQINSAIVFKRDSEDSSQL